MLIKVIRHKLSGLKEEMVDTAKTNMLSGIPFWEEIEHVEETYTSTREYLHVKYKDGSKRSFVCNYGCWEPI